MVMRHATIISVIIASLALAACGLHKGEDTTLGKGQVVRKEAVDGRYIVHMADTSSYSVSRDDFSKVEIGKCYEVVENDGGCSSSFTFLREIPCEPCCPPEDVVPYNTIAGQ